MKKYRGSGYLVTVVLCCLFVSLISYSIVNVFSTFFNNVLLSNVNIRAIQFAESKMDLIKSNGYDSVIAQNLQVIDNSTFYDEVVLGNEVNLLDGIKQRLVTVNIYNDSTDDYPIFSLNSYIYKKAVGDEGSQILTGTGSISFSANGSYKSLTIIVASKFNPVSGTWTGTATCTGYVNDASIGTLVTQTTTSRGGKSGHYWGTTEVVTNMQTFKKNINPGDTIKASITSSSNHNSSTITVILGK